MKRMRSRNIKIKFASLLAAGMLFQATSCSTTASELGTGLVQSIASQWITDFVSTQLGVQQSYF